MGATVDWPTVITVYLLVLSVLCAVVGLTAITLGMRLIAQDSKRRKLRLRAWQQTVAMLNRTGLSERTVIYSDRRGTWRCTVNRRHDASECDGYHTNHDDI